MGDLIKIVGVQYAVNSNHVKGEDMTAQEQQKTIEFRGCNLNCVKACS